MNGYATVQRFARRSASLIRCSPGVGCQPHPRRGRRSQRLPTVGGFAALEQRLVGSGDRLVRMELLGVLPEPEQLHQLVPEHALPPPAA